MQNKAEKTKVGTSLAEPSKLASTYKLSTQKILK